MDVKLKIIRRIKYLWLYGGLTIIALFGFSFYEMIVFAQRVQKGIITFARCFQELTYNLFMIFAACFILAICHYIMKRQIDTIDLLGSTKDNVN